MLKLDIGLPPTATVHGIIVEEVYPMAENLDDKELVIFKEMIMANSIQLDTLTQLLIEKGIFTDNAFYPR